MFQLFIVLVCLSLVFSNAIEQLNTEAQSQEATSLRGQVPMPFDQTLTIEQMKEKFLSRLYKDKKFPASKGKTFPLGAPEPLFIPKTPESNSNIVNSRSTTNPLPEKSPKQGQTTQNSVLKKTSPVHHNEILTNRPKSIDFSKFSAEQIQEFVKNSPSKKVDSDQLAPKGANPIPEAFPHIYDNPLLQRLAQNQFLAKFGLPQESRINQKDKLPQK